MTVREFSESYPSARRRLGDGETVIPTYRHRGLKGWWGIETPLGEASTCWYFYHPFHARISIAMRQIEKILGHSVLADRSSDEELYFRVTEADARLLMSTGPRWCRVRRRKAKTSTPARG